MSSGMQDDDFRAALTEVRRFVRVMDGDEGYRIAMSSVARVVRTAEAH